jgi:hypothetical protein
MSNTINLVDRARIERFVWSVDQRLYELPRKARVEKRRELRTNLLDAASDAGVAAALRDVGDGGSLAASYLDADLGSKPRPSWMAAGIVLFTGMLFLTSLLTDAARAYGDGIVAGGPSAAGSFHWDGIDYLQTRVVYRVANGEYSFHGGAVSPVGWLVLVVTAIAVGRLWRAIPAFRGR